MSNKLKQSISEIIDDELDELELKNLLEQVDKNKQLANLYSDYLFISDCIKPNVFVAKKVDISSAVMQQIKPRKKILQFKPRQISRFAIAASTFFAVTLGFYFYNYDDLNQVVKNDLNLQLNPVLELNLDKNQLTNSQDIKLISKNLNLMPFANVDRYYTLQTKDLKPNEVFISPQTKQYLFDVSSAK